MFDTALANPSFKGVEYLASGKEPGLNTLHTAMPRGEFATADSGIVITCGSDKMFRALCHDVVKRPDWLDDAPFATTRERMCHGDLFLAELDTVFAGQPSAYWSERCKRASIPCGAFRSVGEALTSEEAVERGKLFDLPHPTAGTMPAIGQPYRFSRTDCDYRAAPTLGEHSRAVQSALPGYDNARMVALAGDGAIGMVDPA